MDEPVELVIPVNKGDDGADIAVGVDAAVNAAMKKGKLPKGSDSKVETSVSVATGGAKETQGGGKPEPTSYALCKVVITGVDSVNVGQVSSELRVMQVTDGSGGDGGPKTPRRKPKKTGSSSSGSGARPGGGGVAVVPGPDGGGLDLIDCAKYREELAAKQAEAKKNDKSASKVSPPGEPPEWFCDPRVAWRRVTAMVSAPIHPIAFAVVGVSPDVPEWQGWGWDLMGAGRIVVPFGVVGAADEQRVEIQMRLASAGIVTQDRTDGVIVPSRVLVSGPGIRAGAMVKSFGLVTPYDPYGYRTFPWTIISGEPNSVATHAEATTSGRITTVGPGSAVPAPRLHVAPQRDLWEEWTRARSNSVDVNAIHDRDEETTA